MVCYRLIKNVRPLPLINSHRARLPHTTHTPLPPHDAASPTVATRKPSEIETSSSRRPQPTDAAPASLSCVAILLGRPARRSGPGEGASRHEQTSRPPSTGVHGHDWSGFGVPTLVEAFWCGAANPAFKAFLSRCPRQAHLHAAHVRRRLRRRRQLPRHHRHARRAGQVLQEVAQRLRASSSASAS
jgi:hypothetical protein